ncbi:hypothetical protein EJD97_023288, partial [Solanum chilense]
MPDDVRVCVVPKGDDSIDIPNVVRWCVQSMVDDNIPRPTSSDCVCCPRAMMECHAQRFSTLSMLFKCDDGLPRRSCPTVCVVQGQRCHVTPDVIQPLVLPSGDDFIARTISSHHVCCPKAMMASNH